MGVVGYCMGGGLALVLATQRPDAVAAAAPYYGAIPWPSVQPDWANLGAKVVGEYAENDGWASPEAARALEAQLRELGLPRHGAALCGRRSAARRSCCW